MSGTQVGALLLAAAVTLAACGDGGSGPDPVNLSGTWFGTTSYATASCDGPLPPGIGMNGYASPVLFEMTQSGTEVSADDPAGEIHYAGSFDNGSGGMSARFETSIDGADAVNVTDTVTTSVSGTPLHLTASGQRRSAINWNDPQQPDRVCTRVVTWDLTRRTEPIPVLAAVGCEQEAVLRPSGHLAAVLIRVFNRLSAVVNLYRLDEAGARVPLLSLEPSSGVWLNGLDLPAQPIVVTSSNETCRAIYVPVEGPAFVDVQ